MKRRTRRKVRKVRGRFADWIDSFDKKIDEVCDGDRRLWELFGNDRLKVFEVCTVLNSLAILVMAVAMVFGGK